MRYFTSDLHFGHENVIRFCNRPYADVTDMNHQLIHNWNNTVTNDDEVWILGDFSFLKPQLTVDIMRQLYGRKHLVPGNHDSTKVLHALWELPSDQLVVEERYVELKENHRKIVLCHYPIESWNNMSHGSLHLHGHSHGNSRKVPNRFDVGVDAQNYVPRSLEYFVGQMAGPDATPSRPDRTPRAD